MSEIYSSCVQCIECIDCCHADSLIDGSIVSVVAEVRAIVRGGPIRCLRGCSGCCKQVSYVDSVLCGGGKCKGERQTVTRS